MEGSSVTLTCSSDANPAAKYTWYKRSGDKQVQRLSEETQFVLSSIRSLVSGEYYCTAENELGRSSANIFITVTRKSVKIINTIRYSLVVVLVPVLVWTLWTRMKKTLSLKSEVNEAVEMIESHNCPEHDNVASAAQTEDTEEQEDLV
ncbi:transmembrane and immunoglobulin domain-containing protein 1 [Pleuronectes platessa]|uniref:transmembrane and immunoglobulin domain-containing protein 1 n=1 Tax=Pleuronectes platessa TaxID=8262 RepID=UPI00232A2292|nr:transmembrane and immunoglobulin domain-containing protein 1 [Pleuronectes platessa]